MVDKHSKNCFSFTDTVLEIYASLATGVLTSFVSCQCGDIWGLVALAPSQPLLFPVLWKLHLYLGVNSKLCSSVENYDVYSKGRFLSTSNPLLNFILTNFEVAKKLKIISLCIDNLGHSSQCWHIVSSQ